MIFFVYKDGRNRMNIGICDDNKEYLDYLYMKVKQLLPNNSQIVVSSLIPEQLQTNILNLSFAYDILITDIDMGELNGIELVNQINKIHPSCIVIFISNFLNYATHVYDVEHIYFILKSEVDTRLPKALFKAISFFNKSQSQYLHINYQSTEYRIAFSDIAYIETFGRYLHIHSSHSVFKCIDSFKNIKTKLPEAFIQSHKSYIVNLDYVHSINRTNCTLVTQASIPISYTFSKLFSEAYKSFVSNKINTL